MRFKEHDVVKTSRHIIQEFLPAIPKGSPGTVISVHENGYTVEFPLRGSKKTVIRDLYEDEVTSHKEGS